MSNRNLTGYEIPDENLSYSELKDRIIAECVRSLPAKERILLMAKKLEEDLALKDMICDQICTDLGDVTSERHIRRCLPDEYKQQKKRRDIEESTGGLRTLSANDDKVPEQKAMTVNSKGYEEAFEDVNRPKVESASEVMKNLQKELEDVSKERDILSNEVKMIKEKSQPELLKALQEMFYDKSGLLDAKQLQKISEKAGRDLETIVQRYNTIIKSAIESGEPVPLGTYIITKPDMKLVPVRIFVDFDKRDIEISLWEKKLAAN
jgi:predicted transcriptional regulator